MFRKSYSPIDDQTVLCSMTLWPYGQIDMIQLHWESIFLSYQCVPAVFAGWSFRTVSNITYLSKCLFNPLLTSDEYILLWIPIIVILFLSMAQPMNLGTNSPNLCNQNMHIILFCHIYKVQTIFRVQILFCDYLETMSLDTGAFFATTTSPKDQRGANNKC